MRATSTVVSGELEADKERAADASRPPEATDAASATRTVETSASAPQLAELLVVQQNVLDRIAAGASLPETLLCIVSALEETLESVSAAFLLVSDRDTDIQFTVAPGLPQSCLDTLDRVKVAAPSAAGAGDGQIPMSGSFALVEAVRGAVVAQGHIPLCIEPITSNADRLLGMLLLCVESDRQLGDGEHRVVCAMTQISRFAIEFEGRKAALQSANDRFASLAASIPGVVYQRIVEADGSMRYSYISEAARDLFGVPPEEIVADPQALFDTHGADYAATFRDRLLRASHDLELWDVEATINTRDGRRKYTHAIARPTRRPDGSVQWDGVILDATRIKEAELAAAAAEARVRDAIVESMPHGFVLFDSEDKLVTCNSKLLSLYPQLEATMRAGASYGDVMKAEIEHGLDVEAQTPDSDGNEMLSAEARFEARMRRRTASKKAIERRLGDGRWILIDEHTTSGGGTVILHTDVTDLKDREAALERSNRELNDFASVASHDLREPLRKIEAFGDRLAVRFSEQLGEDGQIYIDRMQSAADRMRSLINDLLSYSQVTTTAKPFQPVSLLDVATEVLSDLRIAIETSGGSVELGDLPTIDAEKTKIQLLFRNLIANAIKFHKEGAAPRIEVTTRIHAQPPPHAILDTTVNGVCEIRVKDEGIGFEMKDLDRIFGIFQQLRGRNEYEGTGVGLATCRKIAELHGGTITAESAPGEGATFIVFLPVRQGSTEAGK